MFFVQLKYPLLCTSCLRILSACALTSLNYSRVFQVSLKSLAELAAVQCTLMPLRQFVDCTCGQFALLGLQFSWTAQVNVTVSVRQGGRGRTESIGSRFSQNTFGCRENRSHLQNILDVELYSRCALLFGSTLDVRPRAVATRPVSSIRICQRSSVGTQ